MGPCLHCDRAGIQTLIASRAAGAALVLAVAGCAPHPRVSLAPHGGGSDCVVADTSAATWEGIGAAGPLETTLPVGHAISDYYLTNPVARSSETMAKCSREFGGGAKMAAE